MTVNKKRLFWLAVILAFLAGMIAVPVAVVTGGLGSSLLAPPICGTPSGSTSDSSLASAASITSVNFNPTGSYVKAANASDSSLNFAPFDKHPEFRGLSERDRAQRKENITKVDGVAIARGLDARMRAFNLGVVFQESRAFNNPGGHLDSQGLYQARPGIIDPKTGEPYWGTSSQVMDPEYAANRFIDELFKVTTEKQRKTLPLVELGILVQNPNKTIYRHDWKWDGLVSAMVGTRAPAGDISGELLDSETDLGGDGSDLMDDCIPASCYFGNYSPVDSLRIATWNREYGNSGSKFRQGLLTLAKQADIINVQELGDGQWSVATSLLAKQGFGTVKREFRNAVPIYYRKSKFDYLDSGEERPSKGSRVESGAGGRSFGNKNVTWIKLRVKSTGAVVHAVNHHIVPSYESGGSVDRDKPLRIALYKKQMNAAMALVNDFKKDGVVFVSADWNYDAEKDEKIKSKDGVRALLASAGLSMNWSKLGFGKLSGTHASDRFIDGIAAFTTKAAMPVAQAVLSSFGSDHKAVVVTYKGEATKKATPEGLRADPVSHSDRAPTPQPSASSTPTPTPSAPQADSDADQETPSDPACEGSEPGGGNPLSGKCLTKKVNVDGESLLPSKSLWYNARLVSQCATGYFKGISPTTYIKGADENHLSGKAVDLMVADWESAEGKANGWKLARWLKDNANDLGIEYIIFDRQIWSVPRADEGWRKCGTAAARCYSGPNPSAAHLNHVHVDTYPGKAEGLGSGSTTDTSGWGFPLKKKYVITSKYQVGRVNPATGRVNLHDGTDYGAPFGAPIIAIADGTVATASHVSGYGNYVTIKHAGGKVISGYAHMSSMSVRAGETVKRGQIIGYVGSTGNSTGAHLHANLRIIGYDGDCGNSHCDWYPFEDFMANKNGIKSKYTAAARPVGQQA